MPEGNTDYCVMASSGRRPGVEGPFALHVMSTRQPVRSQQLLFDVETNHGATSMHVQAEEARSANGPGKSEGCIVPMKPGNSGGGKAAKRWRHFGKASSGHCAGLPMLTEPTCRSMRFILHRDSHRGEPDALTAHVRFWEGAVPNWTWLKSCDTTTGNQVANGEYKP